MKSSILQPSIRTTLLQRINTLQADQKPLWGIMSAPQMLCHLADQIRGAIGQKPAQNKSNFILRTISKWLFFAGLVKTPKKFKTAPEWDVQLGGGTKPTEFEQDKLLLVDLFTQFEHAQTLQPHPFFGTLSQQQWAEMIAEHIDYHLRQFAV